MIIGTKQFLRQSQLTGQYLCPRLLGYPGIGAALNREAICINGFYGAAKATLRLEERDIACVAVVAMEYVRCGEPADPSADDRDALFHGCGTVRTECAARRARARWARSARARVRVGDSLRDSVRSTRSPSSLPNSRNPMSMSYRIST